MSSDEEILAAVRQSRELAELLWDVCEFDLTRADTGGELFRLLSGQPLEGIAGDSTGGTFFLCGERSSTRPVLYASSEGQAGTIGRSLADALAVMIGLPSWWDCLKFSGGGDLAVMQSTVEFLQRDDLNDRPELAAQRVHLATALSLELAPVSVLLARLHEAVLDTTPDFLLTVDAGGDYESLFGTWLPSQNPDWNPAHHRRPQAASQRDQVR